MERRGWYFVMGNGGNTAWHTDRDKLDVADPEVLLRDIRLYALAVFRMASRPVIPLDPGALVAHFAAQVERYQAAAGDRFDLSPARAAFASLAARLAALDAALAEGRVTAEVANAARLAALRHLVPLDYTRGTRFRRDFGLPAAPLTHLAVAAELDRYPEQALGFATTTLRRGLNHVLAAVEAAEAALPTA
ncbi:MAG: hypothetical protein IRZ13_05420 [Acetobacteraceae bacterium]|nr:hypothetical protein [Acetobacteraceae bacterium]